MPTEEELRSQKLTLEIRELESRWNRIGKWIPLAVAVVSVGYSVLVFDAKKTLNEAAAVKAEAAERQETAKRDEAIEAKKWEIAERDAAIADRNKAIAERDEAYTNLKELKEKAAQLGAETAKFTNATSACITDKAVISEVAAESKRISEIPLARLSIQIFSDTEKPEAQRVVDLVRGRNLARIEGIENVGSKNLSAPSKPEIRYFNAEDAHAAEEIAKTSSTDTLHYTARLVTVVRASVGTVELWYPR